MWKFFLKISNFLIPKILFDFICYLEGFRHFKISYSQSGEDLVLIKYLKYKKINNGKYLDIGAFHPRWVSNTHILHKKNFSGYCGWIDAPEGVNLRQMNQEALSKDPNHIFDNSDIIVLF